MLDRDWLGEGWALVVAVWSFELTAVEDRSITVGKIVIALVLLVLGYLVAGRGSRWFRRMATERLNMDAGAAASLESAAMMASRVSRQAVS